MSLPVLVAVVSVGIAIIVFAVHLSGGSRVASFATAEEAAARFKMDFPESGIVASYMTRQRRDAVLELADGHVGLVHVLGKMALTRFVSAGEMQARVSEGDPNSVELLTGDITWPRARFSFGDPETAAAVAKLFDKTPKARIEAA